MKKIILIWGLCCIISSCAPINYSLASFGAGSKKEITKKNSSVWVYIVPIIVALLSAIPSFIISRETSKKQKQTALEVTEIQQRASKEIEDNKQRLAQGQLLSSLMETLTGESLKGKLLAIQILKHRISAGFAVDAITLCFSPNEIRGDVQETLRHLYDEIIDKVFDSDSTVSDKATEEFLKISSSKRESSLSYLINKLIAESHNDTPTIRNALKILNKQASSIARRIKKDSDRETGALMSYKSLLKRMYNAFKPQKNTEVMDIINKMNRKIFDEDIKA